MLIGSSREQLPYEISNFFFVQTSQNKQLI